MNSVDEILKWSRTLPDWQRVMVGRILQNGQLGEQDELDAMQHLKYMHSISDERFILTVDPDSIPSMQLVEDDELLSLLSLSELENVNAITPNQELRFRPLGLTLVYGDNGAGKSGYAKVLKKACWARGDTKKILGNVFVDTISAPASAKLSFQHLGKEPESFLWKDGNPSLDKLRVVSVFDSECARWYINEKGEPRYLPYGTDVFAKLASFCDVVKKRLDSEKPHETEWPSQFLALGNNPTLARLIKRIMDGDKTTLEDPLMNLSAQENERLTFLISSLDGKSEDSIQRDIIGLRGKMKRLDRIKELYNDVFELVAHDSIKYVNDTISKYKEAEQALEIAKSLQFDDGYLSGTGTDPWKRLFESAREFSSISYKAEEFPFIGDGSKCVLCQQPLDLKAKSRFAKFDAFLKDKSAANEKAAMDSVIKQRTKFTDLIYNIKNIDLEVIDELIGKDDIRRPTKSIVREGFKSYEQSLILLLESIDNLENLVPKAPKETNDNLENLTPKDTAETDKMLGELLENLVQRIVTDISNCEALLKSEERLKLIEEKNLLQCRKIISDNRELIGKHIEKTNLLKGIIKCQGDCWTGKITKDGNELINQLVTNKLINAFEEELKMLGLDIPITLQKSGSKGRMEIGLSLSPRARPQEIMSEGEARSASIASFLAEINLMEAKQPIVFDDPVSSLDHRHRELLAARLAKEALKRQVIVLTHDIVFYLMLCSEAEKLACNLSMACIDRDGRDRVGISRNTPPFNAQSLKELKNSLNVQYSDLEKEYKQLGEAKTYTDGVKHFYAILREAWERTIEEVLFQKTVTRFKKEIITGALRRVVVNDSLALRAVKAHEFCSAKIEGHHHSPAVGSQSIPPHIIDADLKEFLSYHTDLKAFQDNAKTARDMLEGGKVA